MKAQPRTTRPLITPHRPGFTLVEILVVMVIITILMGIAIPAITTALEAARVGAVRTEVEGLDQAVNAYKLKYGDYPPDFMDWTIVARHYRKAFPNIDNGQLLLLQRACDGDIANDSDASIAIVAHDPTKIDRAEALYWALGGFSSDPQLPFTGSGGPLEYIPPAAPTATDPFLPVNYQVNTGRSEPLFEFEAGGVTISSPNATAVLSATNKAISSDEVVGPGNPLDLFPIYLNAQNGPYLYFDSRTYTAFHPTLGFNGYGHPTFGVIRPFVSDKPVPKTSTGTYAADSGSSDPMVQAAFSLRAWEFINPTTFQIISAGLDQSVGSFALFDADSSGGTAPNEPLYFQYPSGNAIVANPAAVVPANPINDPTTPGLVIPTFERFQNQGDRNLDIEGQFDNITNFSKGKIVDDVTE